jgi:hypothetical protein
MLRTLQHRDQFTALLNEMHLTGVGACGGCLRCRVRVCLCVYWWSIVENDRSFAVCVQPSRWACTRARSRSTSCSTGAAPCCTSSIPGVTAVPTASIRKLTCS